MLALDAGLSKRLHAALKLAAVYAAGVTLLLIMLVSATDSPGRMLDVLPFYGIPAAVCFAVAFLLLAAARRAGFTALWLVAIGLWSWALSQDLDPSTVRGGFIAWTLLAAPLYGMCALGFRSRWATRTRWRQWMSIGVWLVWVVLVVVALRQIRVLNPAFERAQYLGRVSPWLIAAWFVMPPAVTLAGILRIYSRAPADSSNAAA